MHNCTMTVEKGKLIIVVDIGAAALKAAPPSATGKTKLVATTSGSQNVPNAPGITVSVNVMAKPGG